MPLHYTCNFRQMTNQLLQQSHLFMAATFCPLVMTCVMLRLEKKALTNIIAKATFTRGMIFWLDLKLALFWIWPATEQIQTRKKIIWMSHWRHTTVDGAKFRISCQRPKLLRKVVTDNWSKFSAIYHRVGSMWHPNSKAKHHPSRKNCFKDYIAMW